MCCTFEPAELEQTVVYAGEAEVKGTYVHVLGYQNLAKNLAGGPNAMLLPIPSSVKLGPENVVDCSRAPSVLNDLKEAVHNLRPLTLGSDDDDVLLACAAAGFEEKRAVIFDSGKYTVIAAETLGSLAKLLPQVPERKRPRLNLRVLNQYASWYKGWQFLLCCFTQSVTEPDPIVVWYEPKDRSELFIPGLDAHDGSPPDLTAVVSTDHVIAVGSTIHPAGEPVLFSDPFRPILSSLIPDKVFGHEFSGYGYNRHPNGDFVIPNVLKDIDRLSAPRRENGRIRIGRRAPGGKTRYPHEYMDEVR